MIRFHTWSTPNGMKVQIMLEEVGLPYELVRVRLGKGEQRRPEFLALNRNGKIPVIEDDDGPGGKRLVLAESGAILVYLAEKVGRLMPADPLERLACLQWIMFQMAHVGPMIGQLHHFMSSAPAGNEYGVERYRKEGERILDVLDGRLGETGHLAGADYSIADICTWPWIRSWIHTTKQELGERPSLRRWFDDVGRRPAVETAVHTYLELRKP